MMVKEKIFNIPGFEYSSGIESSRHYAGPTNFSESLATVFILFCNRRIVVLPCLNAILGGYSRTLPDKRRISGLQSIRPPS